MDVLSFTQQKTSKAKLILKQSQVIKAERGETPKPCGKRYQSEKHYMSQEIQEEVLEQKIQIIEKEEKILKVEKINETFDYNWDDESVN